MGGGGEVDTLENPNQEFWLKSVFVSVAVVGLALSLYIFITKPRMGSC